jgi:hypothetical protein
MAAATKNFHLPLPAQLYAELQQVAEASGQPATRLAQDYVRRGLDEERRRARREAIAVYATQVAGSRDDLDPELEAAGLELLRGTRR